MIEVALFGAGRIGKIHAGNIARQPGVRAAATSSTPTRRPRRRSPRSTARRSAASRACSPTRSIRAVVIALVDRHARRPDPARRGVGQGDLLRKAGRPRSSIARASCAEAVKRAGVPCMIGFQRRYDPTFSAVKARIDAGEIGDARDARRDEPRSGRAAARLPEALRRHLQGHADPRLRRLPLDPRRRRGDASTRPAAC